MMFGVNTLAGTSSWTGGVLESSAVITVLSNAVLNLGGSGTLNLMGPLTNAGDGKLDGDKPISPWSTTTRDSPAGGINNLAGALFNVQNDQTRFSPARDGGEYFINAGVFRKSPTAGTSGNQCTFL